MKLKIAGAKPAAKEVIAKPSMSADKTQFFNRLKELGFKHKETEEATILKLDNSSAFYVKLYKSTYRITLWCMEDTYTYKEERYFDIPKEMTVEQLILIFLTINK